jgi:GNAT superfamily N-acetyltransferase
LVQYPEQLVRHRVLWDGTPVTIRPIRPEDSGMEQDFVRHLSEDSRYFRFMGTLHELPAKKLKAFTEVDYQRHMAFVATIKRDDEEVEIGVARYVATDDAGDCEFAIVVDDAWQGTGLAGLLMISLEEAARECGFKTMQGIILKNNRKMIKFARQLGFKTFRDPDDVDTVRAELKL